MIFNQPIPQDLGFVDRTDPANRFKLEIEHFADHVLRGDRNTKYPIEQAVQMQQMLQGIYDSAAAGREIVL